MITLKQALVVLAAKPSFHKVDMDYGMRMARSQSLEADWTPRMSVAIYELIVRHKNELGAYGYDIDDVKAPAKIEPIAPAVQQVVQRAVSPRTVRLLRPAVYAVISEYNIHLVTDIKRLPFRNRAWNPRDKADQKYWEVKFTDIVDGRALADFTQFLKKYEFIVPPEVSADFQRLFAVAISQEKERDQAFAQSFATDAEIDIPNLGGTLRGFQKAGVLYAINKKRCFIADSMGCGKTVQALAVIEHEDAFPALIITRAGLRLNWIKEIRHWLPQRKVTLEAGDMQYRMMQILVLSYEGAVKWYDTLEEIEWKAIILDESSAIKHAKTKRTKVCRDLAKVSKAPIRLCLTGTPIDNNPYEFFSQINFLGQMDKLGGSQHAYERYCGNDTQGAYNMQEMNALMRQYFYIRRLKKDVLAELPAKQRSYVPLEIDNLTEYRRAEKDIISWLRGEVARDPSKFEIDPDELGIDNSVEAKAAHVVKRTMAAEHLVKISHLKQIALTGMLEAAKQWIEEFIESGEKLIVFCHHIEAQRQVYQLFRDVAVWTRNSAGPQAAVDAFQNNPKIKIIVCSLMADNAGHTLTAASNVCFLELGWTPTIHDQAEDRCHRIGQQDAVMAWYLIAQNTIYEKIVELIADKRAVVEAATDGTKTAPQKTTIIRDLIRQLTAA